MTTLAAGAVQYRLTQEQLDFRGVIPRLSHF